MTGLHYIDIHSHVLFNVDDGSKSEAMSLKMLRQAAENKIVHLLATPHANDLTNEVQSERFFKRHNRLKQLISEHQIPLKLSLGSELFFGPGIETLLETPWATFENKRKYLLFELPLYEMPKEVEHFIFERHLEGITPILAHPERYSYLHRRPEKLVAWHHQGCLMQINAGSIIGQFGERVASVAKRMLKAGMVQFVASDAHDPEYRNYQALDLASMQMQEFLSDEEIAELVFENPRRAIEGTPIEPLEINEALLNEDWKTFTGIWERIKKYVQ